MLHNRKLHQIVPLIFLCLLVPLFANSAEAAPRLILQEAAFSESSSGNHQYAAPGETLNHQLSVQVIDSITQQPIPKARIRFKNVLKPSNATSVLLDPEEVVSDINGYARTKATLGSKPGGYTISARILSHLPADEGKDTIYLEIFARSPHWVLLLLMALGAGLAIFMLGIAQLSEGMRRAAGAKVRSVMSSITQNRFAAVLVGALVTVVFQSSSATTVVLVGFVQAGILTCAQSLGIILGADIGTTMTVQLIAFKVTDYAMLAVAVGFFVSTITRRESLRSLGKAIMGAGLVFFGMNIMMEAMYPLKQYEPFLQMVAKLQNPIAAIAIGTIATALLHSSAAFIGIAIVFASQKMLTLETGIALSLGANIGTCITAILASAGASIEAKRVAAAHTLFKVVGVLLLVPFITPFSHLIEWISEKNSPVERQIANAHTIFNIGIATIFLPFLKQFAQVILTLFPDPKNAPIERSIILDDNLLDTPALALAAAKAEVIQLGQIAQNMVVLAMVPVFEDRAPERSKIHDSEHRVDSAYREIKDYLKKVVASGVHPERAEEAFQMLHAIDDIEQIADEVEKRLLPLVEELAGMDAKLSANGVTELKEFHEKTLKQMSRSLRFFETFNLVQARHISNRFERYRLLADELRRTHFLRLKDHVQASEATSEVHLDLLASLIRISDLATNIARHSLERAEIAQQGSQPQIVQPH